MIAFPWTESDTAVAQRIWSEYQAQHDLSGQVGKTVGVDPKSGRLWLGDSIQDVVAKRNADGSDALLFFERVGSKTYYRKGGRR